MAAPNNYFVDPDATSSGGNDFGGTSFTDGVSSSSGTVITKTGAFANTHVNDKVYLEDNGSGDVTAGLYAVTARTNDTITVADVRSGAPEATDVKCTLHDGTITLPWNTLQHAFDVTTRDATDGDRFNVKNGTDDTLIATLTLATYGSPSAAAPLIIQGYTSSQGDGGIGGISGGSSVAIWSSTAYDGVIHVDMHLHDCGAAQIVRLDNNCAFINCEFDNTSGEGMQIDLDCFITHCHFHNIGGFGCRVARGYVGHSFFKNGANDFDEAIWAGGNSTMIIDNIISLDGASDGIRCEGAGPVAMMGNSIYGGGSGTGKGIEMNATGGDGYILNNIVEGFNGAGGVGISWTGRAIYVVGDSAFYNNETNEIAGDVMLDLGGEQKPLAASPFSAPGSDNFEVGTEVKATAYPIDFLGASTNTFIDKGAAQREEPAGGGSGVIKSVGAGGGMVA